MQDYSETDLRNLANDLYDESGPAEGRERFRLLTAGVRDLVLVNRIDIEVFGPLPDVSSPGQASPSDNVVHHDFGQPAPPDEPNPLDILLDPAVYAPITDDEWNLSPLTPPALVPGLLYADVRMRFSAGGTGKTTLALHEAAQLALGLPLWEHTVPSPMNTVLFTREDQRPQLVARLREICAALQLNEYEVARVRERVHIVDLTDEFWKLTAEIGEYHGAIVPNEGYIDILSEIIHRFKADWVIFDPLVSFHSGERYGNDADQALIQAFRILAKRHQCCVEGIGHVGKSNARDKNIDQYAGRGGSALADGARMVAVMVTMDEKEFYDETGIELLSNESGLKMELAKLSYSPKQHCIYIKRKGFEFIQIKPGYESRQAIEERIDTKVYNNILKLYLQGMRLSRHQYAEEMRTDLELGRDEIRSSLHRLMDARRIELSGNTGQRNVYIIPREPEEPTENP